MVLRSATWAVFKRLRQPDRWHPLFRRVVTMPIAAGLIIQGAVIAFIGLILIGLIAFDWVTVLVATLIVLTGLPLILLGLAGTLLGVYWVYHIAALIAIERQRLTYDLLVLTPLDEIGTYWTFANGVLHRSRLFRQIMTLMKTVLIAVGAGLVMALVLVIISVITAVPDAFGRVPSIYPLMSSLMPIGLIAVLIALDVVQSTGCAALVGMIVPQRLPDNLQARLWATLIFLAIQTLTYVTIALFSLILNDALHLLILDDLVRLLVLSTGIIALVYATREMIIRALLWQFERTLHQ